MTLSEKTISRHPDPRFPRVWRKHPPHHDRVEEAREALLGVKPWAGKRMFVGAFDTWTHAIGVRVVGGMTFYGSLVWHRAKTVYGDDTWVLLWPCNCGVWTSDPATHSCRDEPTIDSSASPTRGYDRVNAHYLKHRVEVRPDA